MDSMLNVSLIMGPSGSGKRTTLGALEDLLQYVSLTKVDPSDVSAVLKALKHLKSRHGDSVALHIETRQPSFGELSHFTSFCAQFTRDCFGALTALQQDPHVRSSNIIFTYCPHAELLKRQLYGFHPLRAICGSMSAAIFKECELLIHTLSAVMREFPDRIIFSDASQPLPVRIGLLKDELQTRLSSSPGPPPQAALVEFETQGWNKMRSTIAQIEKLQQFFSTSETTLKGGLNCLLLGESGTGKERIARMIQGSPQSRHNPKRPFVTIDCACIPQELIQSELFGCVDGAFTGATRRPGRVKDANGGILFLDEIGLVDISTQGKLLRFIETKEAYPLGSNQSYQVHCRIVAATSRNLEEGVKSGTFLPDLYYRLSGVTVTIPSLKERREDIPKLINFFMKECGASDKSFSSDAIAVLFDHHWPGNVRELKQVVELCCLTEGKAMTINDLPMRITSQYPGIQEYEEHCRQLGKLSRAAAYAG